MRIGAEEGTISCSGSQAGVFATRACQPAAMRRLTPAVETVRPVLEPLAGAPGARSTTATTIGSSERTITP